MGLFQKDAVTVTHPSLPQGMGFREEVDWVYLPALGLSPGGAPISGQGWAHSLVRAGKASRATLHRWGNRGPEGQRLARGHTSGEGPSCGLSDLPLR